LSRIVPQLSRGTIHQLSRFYGPPIGAGETDKWPGGTNPTGFGAMGKGPRVPGSGPVRGARVGLEDAGRADDPGGVRRGRAAGRGVGRLQVERFPGEFGHERGPFLGGPVRDDDLPRVAVFRTLRDSARPG